MKKLIPIFSVLIFIFSCSFHSEPPNNAPFGRIESLSDLEGIYQNIGVRDSTFSEYPFHFSNIIWPEDNTLNHESLKSIKVTKAAPDTLAIAALNDKGTVVKHENFIHGDHFKLENGIIVLSSKIYFYGGTGDPLAGPKFETIELGLDTEGNGKYKMSGGGAGLIFMMFPVAIKDSMEVRFNKVN
jgi:hypothetical protein